MPHSTSRFRLHGQASLVIALVVCLLSVPAIIGWERSNARATRELENRNMAAMPELLLLRKNAPEYIKAMDAYLKDTVGFRIQANALYRKLRYFVFRDPPMPNITIGRDGHVFLNSPRPTSPYAFFESLCVRQGDPSLKELDLLDSVMARISTYLQGQGIQATFAIAPSTLSLYADKLPLQVSPLYRKACLAYPEQDHLLARLQRQGMASRRYQLFYPYDLFAAHKDEKGFYPKERYHWEGKSAYLFARHLTLASGAIDTLIADDAAELSVVPDDITTFFGFARTIKAYVYPYAGQMIIKMDPQRWLKEFSAQVRLNHIKAESSLSSKSVLMIANSFGLSLAPHLARCFEHVYFLDLNSIQEHEQRAVFAALIKRIRPDYVFFVFDDVNFVQIPSRLAGFMELEDMER